MAKKREEKKVYTPPAMLPKLFPEKESLPSVDSYNLADLPIAPLTYQTSGLANGSYRYEWEQVVGKRKRKFYIEVSYGNTPPNPNTELFLSGLFHIAKTKDTFTEIPISKKEINDLCKIGGEGGKAGQHISRHLQALYEMDIKTNFLYDRKLKKHKTVRSRIISGFTYDADEKGETTEVVRRGQDGKLQTYDINRLRTISFADDFVQNFLQDLIPIDLDKLVKLKNPTPRKLYKVANKMMYSISDEFAIDLLNFCATRLGMRSEYLQDKKKTSRLAAKLRPEVTRVNEFLKGDEADLGQVSLNIVKDKGKPSGYSMKFSRSEEHQLSLFKHLESFTKKEMRVFEALTKQGVWRERAYQIVMAYSKNHGNDGMDYIQYAINAFNRSYPVGKLKYETKRAGILMKAVIGNWYYSEYREWRHKKEKRLLKEEHKRYGKQIPMVEVEAKNVEFDLESFRKEHPNTYQQIETTITKAFEQIAKEVGEGLDPNMAKSSILATCELCHIEWQNGNKDFRPDLSAYEEKMGT